MLPYHQGQCRCSLGNAQPPARCYPPSLPRPHDQIPLCSALPTRLPGFTENACCKCMFQVYLSKMSLARAWWVLARPRTLLDRAWAKIPLLRKIFLGPSPARNTVFLLFYTIKCAGDPPRPRSDPKNWARMVMDETFLARNNRAFFSTQPESGLSCKMLRYSSSVSDVS
jgi:hypothetical protein